MQSKIENLFEYTQLLVLSLIFGIASFLFKVREGKTKLTKFNTFSEISFSLISAYMAFRLSRYFGFKEDLLWIFTGMAAWSGTRFLTKLENFLDKYINKKIEIRVVNEENLIDKKNQVNDNENK